MECEVASSQKYRKNRKKRHTKEQKKYIEIGRDIQKQRGTDRQK
jgi:hypothetical protein